MNLNNKSARAGAGAGAGSHTNQEQKSTNNLDAKKSWFLLLKSGMLEKTGSMNAKFELRMFKLFVNTFPMQTIPDDKEGSTGRRITEN